VTLIFSSQLLNSFLGLQLESRWRSHFGDEICERRTMDMAVSVHFGNSTQMRHMEHDSPSEENNSRCVLANLLSQSLAAYVELEKAHWHLRLNKAAVNFESERPTEIAREVCTISLRLIASISRLQRVLDPDVSPECAALCAVVEEKIAENRELASDRQYDPRRDIATLVSQGPRDP
jgi:hypothetical protein